MDDCDAPDRAPQSGAGGYQAWPAPQWGQVTLVETGALKKSPHPHV